jgi:type 2 lantibiotic biosynthesis protein LanM
MTDETLRQQLAQLCGTRCGRLSFLREYPALARTLVQRMRFWAIACVEMLERLEADERLLTSWLQIEALTLLKATMEMGDDHAHGRSVALVELEGARVIYKPRSQRTIAALRVWAAQVSPDLPWGQFFPEVLDRGKYAWCAHVSNDPCNDKGGLERYYENFGHLLALTHVIGATDLHSENVIANGEWPVVVDGETLLQPKKRQARGVLEECGDHLMDQSPLATGLIPFPTPLDDGVSFDFSAFGDHEERDVPIEVRTWGDVGKASMHLVPRRVARSHTRNQPQAANGATLPGVDAQRAVRDGFVAGMSALAQAGDSASTIRDALQSEKVVRVVLRPTYHYARLLMDGNHPDLLGDMVLRELHFNWLYRDVTWPIEVVAEELATLLKGDIPLAECTLEGLEIDLDGTIHRALIETSAWNRLLSRFDGLWRQSSLVAAQRSVDLSFAVHQLNERVHTPFEACCEVIPEAVDIQKMLDAACLLGSSLCDAAAENEYAACRLEVTARDDGSWVIQATDASLYGGIAGDLLAFQALANSFPNSRFSVARDRLLTTWQSVCAEVIPGHDQVGAFEGIGGLLYVGCRVGKSVGGTFVIPGLTRLLERLRVVPSGGANDLLRGNAGALLTLTVLADAFGDERMQECRAAIEVYAAHLLRTAHTMGPYRTWASDASVASPLVGFAHGSAGISYALRRAHPFVPSLRAAIEETLSASHLWESAQFDSSAKNWRDLRPIPPGRSREIEFASTWCNGSAGIAINRAMCFALPIPGDDQPAQARELRLALDTSLAKGLGSGHSLCHGDAGVAEAFLTAWEARGDDRDLLTAQRIGTMIADDILTTAGMRETAGPSVPPSLGLMSGLGGVAYELLRLTAPQELPSILALNP